MQVFREFYFYILLSISLLLFGMSENVIAADDLNTLTFYRAIEDKGAANIKNPASYDRVVIRISNVDFRYYVERQPAYVVPRTTIESVKVSKSKKYGYPKRLDEDTQGAKSGSNVPQRFSKDFVYSLTFKLSPSEAKRFGEFSNKNKDGSFQLKIAEYSLGVIQVYWPIEANEWESMEFTVNLREDNANKIKEILVPFKDRVIWE